MEGNSPKESISKSNTRNNQGNWNCLEDSQRIDTLPRPSTASTRVTINTTQVSKIVNILCLALNTRYK